MADDGTPNSLPISGRQLRWVYVAGIALNLVALTVAVTTGQQLGALTLGLIIVYLSARYWLLRSS
jgi:hypothetical protein